MNNLLEVLHMQEIPDSNEISDLVDIIGAKVDIKTAQNGGVLKAVSFAFYYGRMRGKQQERQRRRGQSLRREKIGFSYIPTAAESEQINRAYERGTGDHYRSLENVYLLGRVHGSRSKQAKAVAL